MSMVYSSEIVKFFLGTPISLTYLFLGSRILIWIVFFLVILNAIFVDKKPFLLWKEKKYGFVFSILAIITLYFAAVFGAGIINGIVNLLLQENYSEKLLKITSIFKKSYPMLVFTCITAGVTEELLMRGYIQTRLTEIYKNHWIGIVVSALLFGLLHCTYGTISQIIGPFVMGLVFAIFYYKYRSISILIIVHFLIDFIALNMFNIMEIKDLKMLLAL